MVQKIKKRFRELYPTLTLSNDRLDKLVARWANGVTEETNIDELLGTVVDVELLQDIVSLDDSRRNPKPKPVDEPAPTQIQPSNEEPEWAKALKAEIAQLKSEKLTDTKRKQYLADIEALGLHEAIKPLAVASYHDGLDDNSLNALKTTLKTQSDLVVSSSMVTKPSFGGGNPTDTNKLSASEKAYLESKKKN